MNELVLLDNLYSPYCGAVRAALTEKGLAFTSKKIEPGTTSEEALFHYSPMGKIPVLLHDNKSICESVAILEYLDEVFPEPALSPEDPWHRAQMRQAMNWLVTDGAARIAMAFEMSRQHALGVSAGMFLEAKARGFHAALDGYLENREFMAGDFSLADLLYMGFLGPTSFVGVEIHDSMKKLRGYRERLRQRPSYQAAHTHQTDWPSDNLTLGL